GPDDAVRCGGSTCGGAPPAGSMIAALEMAAFWAKPWTKPPCFRVCSDGFSKFDPIETPRIFEAVFGITLSTPAGDASDRPASLRSMPALVVGPVLRFASYGTERLPLGTPSVNTAHLG